MSEKQGCVPPATFQVFELAPAVDSISDCVLIHQRSKCADIHFIYPLTQLPVFIAATSKGSAVTCYDCWMPGTATDLHGNFTKIKCEFQSEQQRQSLLFEASFCVLPWKEISLVVKSSLPRLGTRAGQLAMYHAHVCEGLNKTTRLKEDNQGNHLWHWQHAIFIKLHKLRRRPVFEVTKT